LAGGPGLRGGRDFAALFEGDMLDFYRVELLEPVQRMSLKAELKTSGLGWMEWWIFQQVDGEVILTQTAYFAPHGLADFLFWYFLLPVHHLVFFGLLKEITRLSGDISG
jgi:hypothetical protein